MSDVLENLSSKSKNRPYIQWLIYLRLSIRILCDPIKKNPQEARENLRQATQMANKIHNPNEKNEHMAMIGEAFIEARCYEEAQRTLGK